MPSPTKHHPIIYVRGYAGSQSEVEETVATPFMGFNLGSTKVRQTWTGETRRHMFESPLVRLMKDYGYRDVYSHGDVMAEHTPMPQRSVIIYRYYDQVSEALGHGERPEIEDYARGLDALIARIRKQVCLDGKIKPEDFKVYLVAHSMGGLVCRSFLQNHALGTQENRDAVDKVFTYATPHHGIDVKGIGNLPSFFTRNNADNFNRERMREFLALPEDAPANSLEDKFPRERFFSLVGTNAKDYTVAKGWSSRMVGSSSDGLVRVENAAAKGTPRAFVHRSHSGHYGIVNSEEGYQNLARFLFGDVHVRGELKIHDLRLPSKVERARLEGKEVRASYHIETVVRPRGARYDLHRRLTAEHSAIFRDYQQLLANQHPILFSTYLNSRNRSRPGKGSLVFALDLSIRVPEYQVEKAWARDLHVEGSYLYRETLILGAYPPKQAGGPWELRYGFNGAASNPTPRKAELVEAHAGPDGQLCYHIPIRSKLQRPGLVATLEIKTKPWD